jgi:hypothetical protein
VGFSVAVKTRADAGLFDEPSNTDRRNPGLVRVISITVEQAAKQLEALGDIARLRAYRTLVRAGEAGLPVLCRYRVRRRHGRAAAVAARPWRRTEDLRAIAYV